MAADTYSDNDSTDTRRAFPDGPWADAEGFDVDRAFETLASAPRRAVLGHLAAVEWEDVDALVDRVAARLPADRETLAVALEHVHLPYLDAVGYVAYDHPWVEYAAPRELDALREAVENRSEAGSVSEDALDVICGLLADPLRRGTLLALDRHGTLNVRDVAAHVAVDHPELTADDVALRLHHIHLPRLADAGAIEYDPETTLATPVLPE
ncbi:DUF7344 domain-containing protein [Halomarina litorea]|uniref:DUF7344 domain-containing protein n=1 Tax=Halomarina litorea TaxID=2961595 RepID=UPI0020C3EA36|nr:hypothetical protein [Halomarina sp. BCD28]